MTSPPLRLQTWLTWGMAATFPVMLGRNPFVLGTVTLVVALVATTCVGLDSSPVAGRLLVRTAALVALFTVLFNVLTARTGNQVILDVPDSWLVISGPITWNAVVYGLLSAWALICLIAIWMTVGKQVRWSSLSRILPDRLTGFAVAGSTAINLIPQTAHAWREINEATAVRGFAPSGPRGIATLITPVINGGIDRSMRMAEVLESRGFGSRTETESKREPREQIAWVLLLGGGFMAIYGFSAALVSGGLAGLGAAVTGVLLLQSLEPNRVQRTRFRDERLGRNDWIVIVVSGLSLVLIAIAASWSRETFRYEPYPDITMPIAKALALAPLLLLSAPALIKGQASRDSI